MRYRPLGRTGWEVSELGLGTYPLGGALHTAGAYWSGPATYGAVAPAAAAATIAAALDAGVTFIDTAPVYGEAEIIVGRVARGRRARVATKCGEHVRPAADGGPPVLARDFSRAALRDSLDRSRERLGVDRLDLVCLHSPQADDLGEDPLGLLIELRARGEVGCVGVSVASVAQGVDLVERDDRAEVVQASLNLLEPRTTERLLPLAAERGVGVVVRTPLASGFLTGAIAEDHVFAPDDYRSAMSRDSIARRARQARAFAWLVDDGIASSLSEAALRYVLSFPAVSTVIAGPSDRGEVLANVAAAEAGPLPERALARVRAVQAELGLWS